MKHLILLLAIVVGLFSCTTLKTGKEYTICGPHHTANVILHKRPGNRLGVCWETEHKYPSHLVWSISKKEFKTMIKKCKQ